MNTLNNRLVVQKFGGSSLASLEKLRAVARRVAEERRRGRSVVVVVSAMGNTTSDLVDRAKQVSSAPCRRELDMLLSSGERMSMALLAMAIQEEGFESISLTGPQSGIVTDDNHTNARIEDVHPHRIHGELAANRIVIVAGYQGASPTGEVTTLGRGGSDTTAVALAAALGAAACEIYSDVDGVYSADPRAVSRARHVKCLDARLMGEYSRLGARVLHRPCLNLARDRGVTLRVAATFGNGRHTEIARDAPLRFHELDDAAQEPEVVGVTSRKSLLRVRAHTDAAGRAARQILSESHLVAEPLRDDGIYDVIVNLEEEPCGEAVIERIEAALAGEADVMRDAVSVSVVGTEAAISRLASRMDPTLAEANVLVTGATRETLSLTRLVEPENRLQALRALHESLIGVHFRTAVASL